VSEFLEKIQTLVNSGNVRISEHGFDELFGDRISVRDVIHGVRNAVVVEEYQPSGRGPAILVLEYDAEGLPIHVVWGIPHGYDAPAVLVTAYRPDPERWEESFTQRRK
jgi:hypothetical protein